MEGEREGVGGSVSQGGESEGSCKAGCKDRITVRADSAIIGAAPKAVAGVTPHRDLAADFIELAIDETLCRGVLKPNCKQSIDNVGELAAELPVAAEDARVLSRLAFASDLA